MDGDITCVVIVELFEVDVDSSRNCVLFSFVLNWVCTSFIDVAIELRSFEFTLWVVSGTMVSSLDDDGSESKGKPIYNYVTVFFLTVALCYRTLTWTRTIWQAMGVLKHGTT